jgi:hypothetical protein
MSTLENEETTQVRYRDMSEDPFRGMTSEAGLTTPVYMSAAAFDATVAIDPNAVGHSCQDLKGRFWDVLTMFRAMRRKVDEITFLFDVLVRDPDSRVRKKSLKALIQLDVDGDPFLIFMLPAEE